MCELLNQIYVHQFFEDQSPTVNAALRLQTRCSEKVGKDSSDSAISTRVLIPSSQVGCLIGKGGALISEMRSVTKANIRIFQGEDVPRIARENEEMVQVINLDPLSPDTFSILCVLKRPLNNVSLSCGFR